MELSAEQLQQISDSALKIMNLARTSASFKMKFLSNAIAYLGLQEAQTNLAVDGQFIYYNPLFVISKYKEDRNYLDYAFLHMTIHCLFQHAFIKKNVDRMAWNMACDIYTFHLIDSAHDIRLFHGDSVKLNQELAVLADVRSNVSIMSPERIMRWLLENQQLLASYFSRGLFMVDNHDVWYETGTSGAGTKQSRNKKKKRKQRQNQQPEQQEQQEQEQEQQDQKDPAQKNNQDQDQDQDQDDSDNESQNSKQKKKNKSDNSENSEDDTEEPEDSDDNSDDNDSGESNKNDEDESDDSDNSSDEDNNSDQENGESDNSEEDNEEDSDSDEDEDDLDSDSDEDEEEEDTDSSSDNADDLEDDEDDSDSYPDNSRSMSKSDLAQMWQNLAHRAQTGIETGLMQGDSSGDMLQGLQEVTKEQYSYEEFLRKFSILTEQMELNLDEFDYSFYTYGLELYGNIPLIEPLEYKDTKRIHDFVIAIDTSGSTYGPLVQKFLNKTFNILTEQNSFDSRVCIHIIQCDTRIRDDVKIENLMDLEQYMRDFQIRGGGGTDFVPVFTYVNELIEAKEFTDLRGLIYFTDGYGTFPREMPSYDTAFVFIGDDHCPLNRVPDWAITLELDEDEFKED